MMLIGKQLSGLAKRIFHSPTLREDLATSCQKAKIPSKLMLRAVATRWNSLAEAIGRALELRQGIEKMLLMSKHDKGGKKGLRRFRLSSEEWKMLEQLYPLLKVRTCL